LPFLLCLALALPPLAAAQISGVLADTAQRANILYEQKKWAELSAHAAAWTQSEPEDWRPWRYLGVALQVLKQTEPAAKALAQAVELSPPGIAKERLRLRLAKASMDLGDYAQAEAQYRALLKKSPKHAALLQRLRKALAKQEGIKKREEESETLAAMLEYKLFAERKSLWARQMELLRILNRNNEARDIAERVLRQNPKNLAAAEFALSHDINLNNADAAKKSAERLLKLSPNHPKANNFMAELLIAEGNSRSALLHYEAALLGGAGHARDRAEAYANLAGIAIDNAPKDPADKLELYKKSALADPSYLPAWKNIVIALRALGREQAAETALAQMLAVERQLADKKPLDAQAFQGFLNNL
jgi:tetratricopeptide (TPR) repeat protein